MFRKLLALIMRKLFALVALAAVVWLGARYFAHRGEIKVTLVVPHADSVRNGDPVLEDGHTIGQVIKTSHIDDGADAVIMRIDRDHRRDVVSDSLFSVESRRVVVNNTLAVGNPLEDGSVVNVKEDRLARWLAKHGEAVKPLIEKAKRAADQKLDALDAELASASAKVPDWKKQGKDVLDKNVGALEKQIEQTEDELKRSDKAAEAKKLREKFDRWVAEVQR
jgi:ABC-type transporter Mla subunit MlaD